MGFWSNTRQFISATGGVLQEGMELLAKGASEFERSAHRLNLNAKVMLLEQRKEHLSNDWFAASNTEDQNVLIDTYEELIRDFSDESTTGARAQLAKIHTDRLSLAFRKQVENCGAQSKRIEESEYPLAIDAINARKRLICMLDELLIAGGKGGEVQIIQRARERTRELNEEIGALELKRNTIQETHFFSGEMRTRARRFDGKLDGLYEQWYKNGGIFWSIPFSKGRQTGEAKRFREDGSLLLMVENFNNEMHLVRAYSAESLLLLEADIQKSHIVIVLCFPELKGVSFRHQLGAKLSKFRFASRFLISSKLLGFLWRARKTGPEKERLSALSKLGEEVVGAMEELTAIGKAG